MAGYCGYSMSNNAVDAYRDGEMPLSKWRKSDILETIEDTGIPLKCSVEKLKKLPVKLLKEVCLWQSSWHHTSSYYNETDFYSIDEDRIRDITDKEIDELMAEYEADKKTVQSKSTETKWKCAFLEWSGSRKHPKATEVIEVGIVKGDWFYRENGSKKKTTANGFRFIEKMEENVL